jgi:hypothetical protein
MRIFWVMALALAGCAMETGDEAAQGFDARADYAALCADCHGAKGKGNGPMAANLSPRPANLSRLAVGGGYPTTRVMSKIWGYAGGKGGTVMPAFAPLMEGALIPYDGGDGIETPTPERLVALAEYVKTIQD